MNIENTILDPFKDFHTEADLIHACPTKTKKTKRRWDMVNVLTFSSKYLKTLEIIKNRKRTSDAKKIHIDEQDENLTMDISDNELQSFGNVDAGKRGKNYFRISSPNQSLFKRPENEKYIQDKGPNYWTIVEDVNNKCIQWVSKNFQNKTD